MTVYKDLRFVDEAVQSVLDQTFGDLELIIVDDGNGNDAVFADIAGRDPRIRIVASPLNIGTAAAANLGIAAARADIIARLDADDIAEPPRLAALVAALDADPGIGLVGSSVTLIDEAGSVVGVQPMPETDLDIRWTILFHNPFYHSTVAFRRAAFEAIGRYRIDELVSQDHYLWFDLLPHYRVRNLPEPLVRYRQNSIGLTAVHSVDNPRARTHKIRETEWRKIGLAFDLYDNDLAGKISAFLRGQAIAPESRGVVYRKILDVLAAFLTARRPLACRDDYAAARRLERELLRRMQAEPPAAPQGPPAAVERQMPDYTPWYEGKTLSTDWTTRHFHLWEDHLAQRRHEPLDILEIGSWEGRSAIFFLRYFPNGRLTCIDTFEGSAEHRQREKWSSQLSHIESRFDANLLEFRDRIEKIKSTSYRGLARLAVAERSFDVVFIDGSHHSADTMTDAVLSWPMLKDGGVMIFDDYDWNFEVSEIEKPMLGVDGFLATRAGRYRELHRGYQLIIEKLARA
jgi:glycosyltransferase involved in cell wall biosynthesis/predicted O-methyltransferase YrrM